MKAKELNTKELNTKTTNYPKDTHKEFCDRCFKHNSGCPNKCGGQFKDKECSL